MTLAMAAAGCDAAQTECIGARRAAAACQAARDLCLPTGAPESLSTFIARVIEEPRFRQDRTARDAVLGNLRHFIERSPLDSAFADLLDRRIAQVLQGAKVKIRSLRWVLQRRPSSLSHLVGRCCAQEGNRYLSPMFFRYRLSPSFHHCLLAGGLLTIACLCSTPALAAKGSAKSREESANKARKACLAGDIQTGITILSDLFVSTKEPLWVYNQARCFEQNGRYEEAVTRFEEYLRLTKGLQDKDRDAAQEHLAECQSKLSRTAPPLAPPPEAAAPPPPPSQPVVQVGEAQATPERDGSRLRIAGIAVGAVGVAALAGGLAFNLLANKTTKDLNATGGYDRDKHSTRSTYTTLTWVGYGVGGACLVGGALLYYLGSREANSSSVAFMPTVAPGQAGMSLQGAF